MSEANQPESTSELTHVLPKGEIHIGITANHPQFDHSVLSAIFVKYLKETLGIKNVFIESEDSAQLQYGIEMLAADETMVTDFVNFLNEAGVDLIIRDGMGGPRLEVDNT